MPTPGSGTAPGAGGAGGVAGSGTTAAGPDQPAPPDDPGERPRRPPDIFNVPNADPGVPTLSLTTTPATLAAGFVWLVPSLALSVPGFVLVAAVAAQAVGGLLWIPIVRRRLGIRAQPSRARNVPGGGATIAPPGPRRAQGRPG